MAREELLWNVWTGGAAPPGRAPCAGREPGAFEGGVVIPIRPGLARSGARAGRLDALLAGAAALALLVHAGAAPPALSAAAAGPSARALAGSAFRLATSLAVPLALLFAFLQAARAAGRWSAARRALGPAWDALARRPAVAAAACAALPLAAAALSAVAGPGAPLQAVLGIAGHAGYAVAGLAIAGAWRGWEPGPELRRVVFAVALGAALAAAALVAAHGAAEGLASSALPAPLAARAASLVLPLAAIAAALARPRRLRGAPRDRRAA